MRRYPRSHSTTTHSLPDLPLKIPKDWHPDRFEKIYGIIGSCYNTKKGVKRLDGRTPSPPRIYESKRCSKPVAEQIILMLEIHETIEPEQVADRCRVTRKTAQNTLYRLAQLGKLKRIKNGRIVQYAINEEN